jgi:hypothetical protein
MIARASDQSAEGAQYDSQGQVPTCRDVAPGSISKKCDAALKGRNTAFRISAFQAFALLWCVNQGRRASRLPLAIIFRAFGASVHQS